MVNRQRKLSQEQLESLDGELKAQYELEKWWVEECVSHEREYAELLREGDRISTDKNIRSLITYWSERLAAIIETNSGRERKGNYRKSEQILKQIIEHIEPYELAYLTLTTTANTVFGSHKGYTTFSTMSTILAEALQTELRYRTMIHLEPELPKIVNAVLKESRSSLAHRRKTFTNLFHKRSNARVPLIYRDNAHKIDVGAAMMELLFTEPGRQFAIPEKIYEVKKRDFRWVFKPSIELKRVLYREQDITWLARRTIPLGILLFPPGRREWKQEQMLLTRDVKPIPVNKLAGKVSDVVEMIQENNLGNLELLNSLTYLENVPMQINIGMHQWVLGNKDKLKKAGILDKAFRNIPDCPIQKDRDRKTLTVEEEFKLNEWKRLARKQHNKFWKDKVKVYSQNKILELAEKLSEYDKFYFRWYSDFRGRLYCLNPILSYQSSSLAKSLLEFAEPKKLKVGDSKAWDELVEYGLRLRKEFSKRTEEELAKFKHQGYLDLLVVEFQDASFEFTMEAVGKKNFLPYAAWVLEIKRLLYQWGHEEYCGHPIRKDATCSSMQHMAAMSGDLGVMEKCNVNSVGDKVHDLYTELVPDYQKLGLDRDWIKKFIMTWAYNSTDYSRKKDLRESFEEQFGVSMAYEDADEINDTLKEAATKGLGKIINLQLLFKEVFNYLIKFQSGVAISNTITRFIVDSTKYVYPSKVYFVYMYDARTKIRFKDLDGDVIKTDIRKTRNAWVANIIHSMDACLLHLVLNCLYSLTGDDTVQCQTIHDCVVTRPGDMSTVHLALGLGFKQMYIRVDKTGVSHALKRLLEFWDLETENPSLYKKFIKTFKAAPDATFDNMKYFFI